MHFLELKVTSSVSHYQLRVLDWSKFNYFNFQCMFNGHAFVNRAKNGPNLCVNARVLNTEVQNVHLHKLFTGSSRLDMRC